MRSAALAAGGGRSTWRAAFAGACVAVALLAMPATASAFVDENDYACHQEDVVFNGAPLSQRAVFYPGRCNRISAEQFAQEPLLTYYLNQGFDRNFLLWAPIVVRGDIGSRKWAGCVNPHAHGTVCSGAVGFGFAPSDDFPGPVTVKSGPGDAFIALVCGNASQTGGRAGPIPTLQGTKYLDANANGQRDSGEPGLAGWTIQLRYLGTIVTTTTTDASGNYSFALDANQLPLGAGQYSVTEVQRAGYQQTAAPGPVAVNYAVGASNYSGRDFGSSQITSPGPDGGAGGDTPGTPTGATPTGNPGTGTPAGVAPIATPGPGPLTLRRQPSFQMTFVTRRARRAGRITGAVDGLRLRVAAGARVTVVCAHDCRKLNVTRRAPASRVRLVTVTVRLTPRLPTTRRTAIEVRSDVPGHAIRYERFEFRRTALGLFAKQTDAGCLRSQRPRRIASCPPA